jgi:hypothetical protein
MGLALLTLHYDLGGRFNGEYGWLCRDSSRFLRKHSLLDLSELTVETTVKPTTKLYGCPRFARANLGRERRAKPLLVLFYRSFRQLG